MITIDLSGRTVLVTGASGGMGSAIAERFGEAGAHVVVHYRSDEEGARRVVGRLETMTDASMVTGDLTDSDAVERIFTPSAPYGPVDVLVNNAGIYPTAPLLEISQADWATVHRINVEASFLCLQAAARSMASRGGGNIVNIASLSALRPGPNQGHYNSSKAAVLALTGSAANELAPLGIRVNAVSPGLVSRDGLESAWPDGVASWRSRSPLSRLGEALDVANACLFLASPLAAWITGQNLVVDGGISAGPAY